MQRADFDLKSGVINASEIGDCNENAMRMISDCGIIFSGAELG